MAAGPTVTLERGGLASLWPVDPHLLSIVPFLGLLLAIAVLPLTIGHWWHSNRNKLIVSLLLALPTVVYLLTLGEPAIHKLLETVDEYVSFICLLGSLYVISGGIVVQGDLRGSPIKNTLLLLLGSGLANLIGTTGASMVLIRPFLRMNQGRKHSAHLVVFFIFTVSNIGGSLTPLADPPLFLGFLKKVDFWWTLQLWKECLLALGLVLSAFLIWDTLAYRREGPLPRQAGGQPLAIRGLVNLLLLAGVVLTVLAQAPTFGRFVLTPPMAWGALAMLSLLSLWLTPTGARQANGFTWGPIVEVAIVFAGLFATMAPALELLKVRGHRLGITEPWQYFWLTGVLSSLLDNAPTYLAFATLAAQSDELGLLMLEAPRVLAAISTGAVFMGAVTYIGNGPNFMVKAIADEWGTPTPSFFGYGLYSAVILLPTFVLVTLLFFSP